MAICCKAVEAQVAPHHQPRQRRCGMRPELRREHRPGTEDRGDSPTTRSASATTTPSSSDAASRVTWRHLYVESVGFGSRLPDYRRTVSDVMRTRSRQPKSALAGSRPVLCVRFTGRCGLVMVSLLAAAALQAQSPAPLTNIIAIKALSVEDAMKKLPVRLRAVTTSVNPAVQDAFIQDETGAVYLEVGRPTSSLHIGDLVEVTGVPRPRRVRPRGDPRFHSRPGNRPTSAPRPATAARWLADALTRERGVRRNHPHNSGSGGRHLSRPDRQPARWTGPLLTFTAAPEMPSGTGLRRPNPGSAASSLRDSTRSGRPRSHA